MDLRERSSTPPARHPWEVARARFFEDLLEEHGLLRARTWLDVGAGDAWFASELGTALPSDALVTAWDINYSAEDLQRLEPGDARVELASERPSGRFERILLLDVIEHVDDDAGFLTGIVDDLLEPDGVVLISVPAYQSLFSMHDTALGHHRRYSPEGLRAVAEGAGLRVDAAGGLFVSLLGARAAGKLRDRRRSTEAEWTGIGAWTGGPMVTRSVVRALTVDATLCRVAARHRLRVPGLSTWVLCTRDA